MAISSSSSTGIDFLPARPAIAMPRQVATFLASPASPASPASLLDPHPGRPQVLAMKVAGSGRTDLVQLWTDTEGRLHATTYLAEPAGGGVAFRRAADTTLGDFGCQYRVLTGDLDGDGRGDLIVAYADGPARELHLAAFLADGGGFRAGGSYATGAVFSPRHLAFFALDTTGDGRTDLVEAYERADNKQGGLLTFRTFRSFFGEGRRTFGDAIAGKSASASRPAGEVLGFWPLAAGAATNLVRVYRRSGDDHLIAETFLAGGGSAGIAPFATAVASDLGAFPLANQQEVFPLGAAGGGPARLVQAWTEIAAGGMRLHLSTFFGDATGRFAAGPDSVFADPGVGSFLVLDSHESSPSLLRKWIGAGRQMLAAYRGAPDGSFRSAGPADAGKALPGAASALYLVGDADGDGRDELIRLRLGAGDQVEVVPFLLSEASEPFRSFERSPFRLGRTQFAAGG